MYIEIYFNDGQRRTYQIQEVLVREINAGAHFTIEMCHPNFGEVFIVRVPALQNV